MVGLADRFKLGSGSLKLDWISGVTAGDNEAVVGFAAAGWEA